MRCSGGQLSAAIRSAMWWYRNAMRPRKIVAKSDSAKKLYEDVQPAKRPTDTHEEDQRFSCGENVRQYLLNSTLHGLRYVGETHITIFER